jgi:hypothetical protein
MAYNFVAASSQYLSAASAPVSSPPFTLSCRFYVENTSTTGRVLIGLDNASGTDFYALLLSSSNVIFNASSGGSAQIGSSVLFSINQWNHACAVVSSITNRELFLNGASVGTSTDSKNPAISLLKIGTRTSNGVVGNFMQGSIAEVGIWSVALTAAEIASLSKGATCNLVRPQSLAFYAPLIRNLQDVKGGLAITNNNTAIVADHPPIYA